MESRFHGNDRRGVLAGTHRASDSSLTCSRAWRSPRGLPQQRKDVLLHEVERLPGAVHLWRHAAAAPVAIAPPAMAREPERIDDAAQGRRDLRAVVPADAVAPRPPAAHMSMPVKSEILLRHRDSPDCARKRARAAAGLKSQISSADCASTNQLRRFARGWPGRRVAGFCYKVPALRRPCRGFPDVSRSAT